MLSFSCIKFSLPKAYMNSSMRYTGVFLFFLFCASTASSQEKSRREYFSELSRPEKWWVITHPFSAGRALEISLHARKVSKKMEDHPELDGDGRGGQVDAFRHAYWMALMTIELNHKRAWRLGYDHEKGNKLQFLRKKGEYDGLLPTAADCTMDMHNNEAGIAIGLKYPDVSREELREIIIEKLLDGHFIMLKKDTENNFLDCHGNVISREDYYHSWEIPVCLVPTNFERPEGE